MPSYDEVIHISAAVETEKLTGEKIENKTALDYFSLALTTFGVGYLPLAPGTWGSAVGVLIYLVFRYVELGVFPSLTARGWESGRLDAWSHAVNAVLFLAFCLIGIWASSRATRLFQNKDPQQAVVDEVIGQLLTFLFVPFTISYGFIIAGFLLFRLFDIWKPYPIDSLQNLPAGIGVCADDILAGVYAGTSLSLIYAISISI